MPASTEKAGPCWAGSRTNGRERGRRQRAASATASMVMRSWTSSLTSGANASTPKSLRFNVVVASKPMAGRCAIGCMPCPFRRACRTTGLSMPLMRRMPSICSLPSPPVGHRGALEADIGIPGCLEELDALQHPVQLGNVRSQLRHRYAQIDRRIRQTGRVVAHHAGDAARVRRGLGEAQVVPGHHDFGVLRIDLVIDRRGLRRQASQRQERGGEIGRVVFLHGCALVPGLRKPEAPWFMAAARPAGRRSVRTYRWKSPRLPAGRALSRSRSGECGPKSASRRHRLPGSPGSRCRSRKKTDSFPALSSASSG